MKRPFRTVYFHDQAGKVTSSYGHSCSERGAVRCFVTSELGDEVDVPKELL